MPPQPHHETTSYRDVDISDDLPRRQGAVSCEHQQAARLVTLAQRIAHKPRDALQALVDVAMAATQAHAGGLSLAESHDDTGVFRWLATAGTLGPQIGGTMPRWFSPCGDVLRKDALTLMRDPAHHYAYLAELGLPIHETLLAPFHFDGVAQGTVWVVSQQRDKSFDAADGRALVELADFVTDSAELLERLRAGVPH